MSDHMAVEAEHSALDEHLALETQTAALADLISGADLSVRVPTCPDWDLRELVAHVGNGQRWVAELVRRKAPPPQPTGVPPADPGPWLREGALLVTAAVRDAGDAEIWTFLGPKPAPFWTRRMRNDVIVHRADAALALGRPFEVDVEAAVDVISEGFDIVAACVTMGVSPALTELRGEGRLRFVATDASRAWSVERTATGVTWPDGNGAADVTGKGAADVTVTDSADVTVTGSAADLLLLVNRRASPDSVRVDGDAGLLSYWLDHTAF